MEMGSWGCEIVHLKCPAVLGAAFESPDLVGDVRFWGALIALSLVADFSPLFYQQTPQLLLCTGRMWKTQNWNFSTQYPTQALWLQYRQNPFFQAHHIDSIMTALSPIFSRSLKCLLCFLPKSTAIKDEGHISCTLLYLQRHSAPLFPLLSRLDTFLEIQWFSFIVCQGFLAKEIRALERVGAHPNFSQTCALVQNVCSQTTKHRGHLRTGNIAKGTPQSRTNHVRWMKQKSCWKA